MTRVLIIGAGPAGLGAAQVLAKAGVVVTVVERQAKAGGIPRLCGHSPFGMREFHQILGGQSYVRRLVDDAVRAGAQILLNHSVVAIDPGPVVRIATPDGITTLTPDRILLATGAREASRAERLLPGERPLGIVTTGALQDLWFARHALPFRRPVILGSELVAMSAILTCRQAGARPVAVIEPAAYPITRAPFRWLPKALRIPFLTGTTIEDMIAKDGRLAQLVLRGSSGQLTRIDCDGLVLTGSFRPETGLARMCGIDIDPATQGPAVDQYGRTSRPEIYAAGNLLRGIETAGHCWAEGRQIAQAMIADFAPTRTLKVTPGAGLRYVVPQRIGLGAAAAVALQIRLDQPARGTLIVIDAENRHLAARQFNSGPERRITVTLDPGRLRMAKGPLTVTMEQA